MSSAFEITIVGDIHFGRYRGNTYLPIPKNAVPLLQNVHELIASDLVVGNLETPLVGELPATSPISGKYRFGASAGAVKHLADAGFDVVGLANNHAYDLAEEGVRLTPVILRGAGICSVGSVSGSSAQIRVETVQTAKADVAFVALTACLGTAQAECGRQFPYVEPEQLADRVGPIVREARRESDVVVVMIHWGTEYADRPCPWQIQTARDLVDAGAHIVAGHHPHVLQAIEYRRGGVVAYSLGNFLFDNIAPVPRQTGVLRVGIDVDGNVDRVVFHPAYLKNVPVYHPSPAHGPAADLVCLRMQCLSAELGTVWDRHENGLHIALVERKRADRAT